MQLDRSDRTVLAKPRRDGRLTSREIAAKLRSCEAYWLRRVQAPREAYVIDRHVAFVCQTRVGLPGSAVRGPRVACATQARRTVGAGLIRLRGKRTTGAPAGVAILMLLVPFPQSQAMDGGKSPARESTDAAPLYARPVDLDQAGRVLAEVKINGRGPYRFILDTGANRSALSPLVAEELGLVAVGASSVIVHGVTGSATLPIVDVANLQVGDVVLESIRMPVLPASVLADADGILGVDGLQRAHIDVNFVTESVTVRPSTGRRAPSEYLVVPARVEHGGLLIVRGSIGRLPVRIIIDTGAERTLGNAPLRDALLSRLRAGDRVEDATVIGATPGTHAGVSFLAPMIRIGEARLRHLPVTFADLHVFEIWGLKDEPALLIGMDLIGSLERFAVDYRQREFHLKLRPTGDIAIRHCRRPGCGSRLAQ
jgi:predicted aspartyl protease